MKLRTQQKGKTRRNQLLSFITRAVDGMKRREEKSEDGRSSVPWMMSLECPENVTGDALQLPTGDSCHTDGREAPFGATMFRAKSRAAEFSLCVRDKRWKSWSAMNRYPVP